VSQLESRVSAMLAPILRDADATGVARPRIAVETAATDRARVTISGVHGDSYSFDVQLDRPSHLSVHVLAEVAERVQEWIIEELWASGSNWPPCPAHPSSHPLEIKVKQDSVVWTCPRDAKVSIPLGTLGPNRRRAPS
jgi:hypothetical protein